MARFVSYRGSLRTEYLGQMYDVLLNCARYNRRFYEEFMDAKVIDVGHENGKLVFKIEMRSNPEIYAIAMRQLGRELKDSRIIITEPENSKMAV